MSVQPGWHNSPPHQTIGSATKKQSLVMAIIVIVIGLLVPLILLGPRLASLSFGSLLAVVVLTGIVVAAGTWFYTWLDRWEPEPPLFLLSAFLWGGGVSILGAGLLNDLFLLVSRNEVLTAIISAPLTEESFKGLFLVLVLLTTARGRAEFNSRTDAFVYAGFVGMGFTLVEDIHYLFLVEGMGESGIGNLIVRTITGTFTHAVFTSFTAWGLWKAFSSRGSSRWLWAVLGWFVAVLLHGVFNFLASSGQLLLLVLFNLAMTGVVVWQALASRKEETRAIQQQLPVLVSHGWITPNEAGWLAARDGRKATLRNATARSKSNGNILKHYMQNVTELCLLRQRLDAQAPGPFSPELLSNHYMLVGLVTLQKNEVEQMLGSGPWQQVAPRPGAGYNADLPSAHLGMQQFPGQSPMAPGAPTQRPLPQGQFQQPQP